MIDYRFTKQINPRYHYFNINFDDIKASLSLKDNHTVDFNSLIAIKRPDYFFTVNKLGHIIIHYNDISKEEIKSIVLSVNNIFNKYDYQMDYPLEPYTN